MHTLDAHPRVPWIAMLLAGVLLIASALAACRVTPPRARPAPERVSYTSEGPDLRVRLRSAIEKVAFSAPAAIRLYAEGDDQPSWLGEGPVEIVRAPSGFRLVGTNTTIAPARTLRVEAEGDLLTLREGDATMKLAGDVTLAARSDASPDAFDVIEGIPLERYLPGVLAKELYHHFDPVAYEAQAIAARSYAMHERARKVKLGIHFDLEASTLDQAYGGAGAHPRAVSAARATRGRVLNWQGGTLRAYYSSTCADRPASARDTWPITAGYEFNLAAPLQARSRACACASSPKHRWTLKRSVSDAAARLRAWGESNGHDVRRLKDLRAIDTLARNDAGRPSRYRVTDSAGVRYELSAEELRVAFNTSAKGQPKITSKTRVLSGDLRIERIGDTLLISGRGFGHGVGLCQFGADGLAKQGLTPEQILKRYYPGATISKAY